MDGIRSVFDQSAASLKSMVGAAQQFQNYQEGITKLSSEQLKNLSKKLQKERESLQNNQQALQNSIDENKLKSSQLGSQIQQLQNQRRLSRAQSLLLSTYKSDLDKVNKKIEDEETLFEQVNRTLVEANDELNQMEASIDKAAKNEKLNERFEKLNKTTQKIESTLGLSFGLATLVSLAKEADTQMGEFAKSSNKSYSETVAIRQEFDAIAKASGDNALNGMRMLKSQQEIGEALGTNAKLNVTDLKTLTKLREQAGLTTEEMAGMQQLSLVNGKTLKQNVKEVLGSVKAYAARNKLVVNEKQILKEVSKASASLKLSLGGSAEAVAIAATKAKQFGINLEQADKMAQSLLNFEESIESELSAELLTGKNLNFERARALALNGKTADAAAEIASQVGTSADFAKMNVIQQDAIAKSIGMSRDELAQSLIDREALAEVSKIEGTEQKKQYDSLVASVGQEAALKALRDGSLKQLYDQQNTQEQFSNSIEKIKQTYVSYILPVMEKVSKFLADHSGLVAGIVTSYITLRGLMMAQQVIAGISFALEARKKGAIDQQNIARSAGIALGGRELAQQVAIAAAWVIANPIKALVGLGLAAGVGALVYSQMKDGVIDSKGGMVVSGEKGSIQLDKEDSIIAGTNLFGGKDKKSSASASVNIDMSAVVNAVTELRRDINALANRSIIVQIDGKNVTKAIYNDPNTVGDESRTKAYQIS
jgi:myosin heavy subunit